MALFKYFKREDNTTPRYARTQCSWWRNTLQGAKTKFL